MIALLQRVSNASVTVAGQTIAQIESGLLAFIGIEHADTQAETDRLLRKILGYRVFEDADGKMNNALTDIKGDLLLVPQFTLVADTQKGMRPSFSSAASPEMASALFETFCQRAVNQYPQVAIGQFGADMQVSLVNDGPVTFWLHVKPEKS